MYNYFQYGFNMFESFLFSNGPALYELVSLEAFILF